MRLQGRSVFGAVIHLTIAIVCLAGIQTAQAKIVVPPTGSVIEVDTGTLKSVIGAFEQAEEGRYPKNLERAL